MKQTDMKWFECTAEKVEMIYQLMEAENAQDAERQFRELYSDVSEVYVKEWEWFEHNTQMNLRF
jgi:hypothetical protein